MTNFWFYICVMKETDNPIVVVRSKIATKQDNWLIDKLRNCQTAPGCQVVVSRQAT